MESAEQLSLLGSPEGRPVEPDAPPVPAATVEPKCADHTLPPPRELAPMLQQYLTLKKKYSEHLLLFQVGDFYEIFFEDAPRAAEALNIRLTSRNKEDANPTPMCGVPVHALDNYLPRLPG